MSNALFNPLELEDLVLANRIAMSPMTRSRYGESGVPGEMHALYYAQRAEAGLIMAEATRVSPRATGYVATPGIFNDEQVAGWKRVTDAVHEAGGKIFCQLWHVGRVSHTQFQPDGLAPLAPSAITAPTQVFGREGMIDASAPREMTAAEIKETIEEFRIAAENAARAGFDGVDIHAGNGYLLHQFMSEGANQREDEYGGSIENRLRFLGEVIEAVRSAWPLHRVSLRLGPQIPAPGIPDFASWDLYKAVVELAKGQVGMLHIGEFVGDHPMMPPGSGAEERWAPRLKEVFEGPVIINGGLTGESAAEAVSEYADLASFGIPFLANPDLPSRIRLGVELNNPRPDLFYGGGEEGYTDYPRWEDTLGFKLSEVTREMVEKTPSEKLEEMRSIMDRVLASGIDQQALRVGDKAPDFELPDAEGQPFSLQATLKDGPVVVSFYRGGWCPFCNLELQAFHQVLGEIREHGASLVAISPELPDYIGEQEVDFPVLSDLGNEVARQFGLVFKLDPELKKLYDAFGIDLEKRNGTDSAELPVPGTFVIQPDGEIVFAQAKGDHSKRAEPRDVLVVLERLQAVPS